MSEFVRIPLNTEINIENVITMHIFDYNNEFVFEGELHDFWELVCVYEGSTMVSAGEHQYTLKQGEVVFHEPLEFHAIHTSGKVATKLIVITFDANGGSMEFFRHKILNLDERGLDLLNDLIDEGKRVFELSHNVSQLTPLRESAKLSQNSYQMLKNLLELFLLNFIHSEKTDDGEEQSHIYSIISGKNLVQKVMEVLKEKKYSNVNIDELCSVLHVSKSYMCSLFKKYTGKSIIDYYNSLKIEEAKKRICDGNRNITEISEDLGFSSIHYFSRIFKKYTCMSPSSYAKVYSPEPGGQDKA